MISFIIKVQCCWLLFFGFYYLFIRKETYFNANRFYLISSLILGLVIPLLPTFSFYQNMGSPGNFDAIISLADQPYFEMVATPITETGVEINWVSIIGFSYLIGLSIFLGKFLLGMNRIYRLYRYGQKQRIGNKLLVKAQGNSHAFSFFNMLFIGNEFEGKEYEQVLNHELSHAEGGHSYDILFVELLNILFWFSPFIYWYKKAIRITHEYIADQQVVSNCNRTEYGRLLISHAHSTRFAGFANFIFRSPLKTRIQMMYSKRTSRKGLIKYFSILPLTFFVLLLFSNGEVKAELEHLDSNFDLIEALNVKDTIPPAPPVPPAPPKAPEPVETEVPPAPPAPPKAPVPVKADVPAEPPAPPKAPEPVKHSLKEPIPPSAPSAAISENKEVFIVVEEMPLFPGCEKTVSTRNDNRKCTNESLLKYIIENLKYPPEARENGIEGKVVASLIVRKDGTIDHISIERDIGSGCGDAVSTVLHKLKAEGKKWTPGKQRSRAVDVKIKVPVSFTLDHQSDKSDKGGGKSEKGGSKNNGTDVKLVNSSTASHAMSDDIVYIMDGKRISNIENINPDDIKKIEVIKSPEEVAKYAKNGETAVIIITIKNKKKTNKVFEYVDEMPMFPGCDDFEGDKVKCSNRKLIAYVVEHLKYPKEARENGVEGKVVSQFTIDSEGVVTDIKILKSLGFGCDEEVVRLLEMMKTTKPRWTPGKKDGDEVAVKLTLPISFKLPGSQDK